MLHVGYIYDDAETTVRQHSMHSHSAEMSRAEDAAENPRAV